MTNYAIGSRVRIVGGAEGVVVEVLAHLEPPSYRIFLTPFANPLISENDLEPIDRVESDLSALLRRGVFANASAFRFAVTQRKLADQLTDTLFSYNAARIQIQAHQFKPLLKLLDSPYRRLLIADEVGLGKTIEAGIILSEFDLRERLERVLVVCPHALVLKWKDELDAKFGMRFELWSAKQMRAWVTEAQKNAYASPMRAIVSLEGMRATDLVDLLQSAPVAIDCLIVDEAHHLRNDETQSYALGEALIGAADIALFLSATPLNLRNRDLFNLVHLLLPDVYANEETFAAQVLPNQALNRAIRMLRGGASNAEIREIARAVYESDMSNVFVQSDRFRSMIGRLDDPQPLDREERVLFQRLCMDLNTLDGVLTRTKKSDVAPFAVRDPKSITLNFSAEERAFYDAVTAFCLERYASTGGTGFGAITYQRQVCSCVPAMGDLLIDLADAGEDRAEVGADIDDEEVEHKPFSPAEQQLLDDAISAAHAVGDVDTKFRCLEQLLAELIDQSGVRRVMLFSFFRRTIRYLERRLNSLYRVGVIMGGMSLEERAEIVDRFKRGELQLLLASEVGGEGLDFQFCNVLVNYDLPWNPMRVEQRIGRLDRYGQEHEKILIYNLLVDETVEARIFGRLFERIELFNAAIGDLEAILGDTVASLTRAAMDLRLTPGQQTAKAELLAQQLIHRKELEEQLSKGKDALLSNEQYFLDRFGSLQRGRAYLTANELANFCAEALKRHFPGSRITRSGSRWWFRPDAKFVEYVRREVYEAGADGRLHHVSHVLRPLLRLRAAADGEQALPITFEADEGFDNRQLELLSPQHPYVQALVRRNQQEPLNRLSVARLRLTASADLEAGTYLVVLYKLQSTGLRPLRRLEAVAVPIASAGAFRMPSEWLGQFLDELVESEERQGLDDAGSVNRALERADQLLENIRHREGEDIGSRQGDLVRLRLASLQYAFERKRERLQLAIARVANSAIKRLRRGELANATARHEAQVATLGSQNRVTVTFDRVAAAIVDVI